MVNKKQIIDQLLSLAKEKKKCASEAFSNSKEHTTADDMKPEGKYDTRSIEAGYIAGAQKVRLDELSQEIKLLEEINIFHDNNSVSVGSLTNLNHNGRESLYFVSSTSGGHILKIDDKVILIISAFSPLGSELIGSKVGDDIEVEINNENRCYEILSIW